MNTIQVQKTRWLAWAATALLLGAANIAQAGWVTGPNNIGDGSSAAIQSGGVGVTLTWDNGPTSTTANAFSTTIQNPIDKLQRYIYHLLRRSTKLYGYGRRSGWPVYGNRQRFWRLSRNIGGAGWVVNNYASLSDAVFSSLGTDMCEKQAAVQMAVWRVAFNATITGGRWKRGGCR